MRAHEMRTHEMRARKMRTGRDVSGATHANAAEPPLDIRGRLCLVNRSEVTAVEKAV